MFRRILLASLFLASTAMAQEKKTTAGDEMIYKYLCAEADKLSQKFADGAKSVDEWQQKRPRLYQEYMHMLGLWPLPEKTPLNPVIHGKIERDGYTVEKVFFASLPGHYVTGNLYRPAGKGGDTPKRPGVLLSLIHI